MKPRSDGQALGCVSRLVGVCKSQFKVIPSKPSMAAQQRATLTARRAVPHRVNGHRHSPESLPVSLPRPVPIQAPMQALPSTAMGPFNSLGPRVVCPPQHDGWSKHRNYHGHHERQQQQQHRVEGLQPLMLQHYSSSGCSNNGNNLGRTGMVMHQCGPGGLTRYQTPPHTRSLMRVDPHHSGVFTSLPARFVSPSCEQASDNDSNSIDGRESLPPSHESAMRRSDLP
uniref:Uncharacterized protein n=1 Tax=Craspedostauros australis TaxID=1486917 RepID=A0A7R9ZT79_9STRA